MYDYGVRVHVRRTCVSFY